MGSFPFALGSAEELLPNSSWRSILTLSGGGESPMPSGRLCRQAFFYAKTTPPPFISSRKGTIFEASSESRASPRSHKMWREPLSLSSSSLPPQLPSETGVIVSHSKASDEDDSHTHLDAYTRYSLVSTLDAVKGHTLSLSLSAVFCLHFLSAALNDLFVRTPPFSLRGESPWRRRWWPLLSHRHFL